MAGMKLKRQPEDFRVEELPLVEGGDAGRFAFYRLTKRGVGTLEALEELRRRWNLSSRQISYGGLKDRHAVTIQYLTILDGPDRGFRERGLDLEALAARRPAELSGGQQQRVALARALAPAPRLLLLDEPLSALDLKLRRGMQVELKRLQRETGITFLLVTHDQEEALAMSDVIAVMQAGRIEQIGTPSDVWTRPRSRFVADFFGANVLEGRLAGPGARAAALRPEDVEVARSGATGGAQTTVSGRVVALSYHGAATACDIALDEGGTLAALRADLPPGLAVGDAVACSWSTVAAVPLEA